MANNLIISVDSTTPMTQEMSEKYGIICTYLTFMVNGEVRKDAFSDEVEKSNFYDLLRDGAEATHENISPKQFIDVWEPLLKEGKTIYHLSISSKISGAFMSACTAADTLNKVYEDSVLVFDSQVAGGSVAAMAIEAAELSAEGATLEHVDFFMMQEREKYHLILCVDDISRARKEGHHQRVSGGRRQHAWYSACFVCDIQRQNSACNSS